MSDHSLRVAFLTHGQGTLPGTSDSGPAQPQTARARQRSGNSDAPAPYPDSVVDVATTRSDTSGRADERRRPDSARTGGPQPLEAACRTAGCRLPGGGALGYCDGCEAVYRAAQVLREQLLARRGRRLHAAHRPVFDALSPALRERLLAHVAASSADQRQPAHVFSEHGLEDFLAELLELGLFADGEVR
jgi:hypothetical protein